jgi:RNA polymerase sigma-70 factor (ECF subfamily)
VGTQVEELPEFEAEFNRLFSRAYAVARRLIGDGMAAEDVAAEALIRTYVHWRRVRAYEHREAWVARVATNLALKAARQQPTATASVCADPSDATTLRLALVAALDRLPRREREAVVLRYLADLSIDDVARTMGVSAGTIKQSVHRALRTLRSNQGIDLAAPISEEV